MEHQDLHICVRGEDIKEIKEALKVVSADNSDIKRSLLELKHEVKRINDLNDTHLTYLKERQAEEKIKLELHLAGAESRHTDIALNTEHRKSFYKYIFALVTTFLTLLTKIIFDLLTSKTGG